MNSRERVMTAVALAQPDRTPMDFAANTQTQARLFRDLGVMANYQLDRFTEFYVAFFDRMFSAAPGKIDILRIADDFGMQDRLLFSPEVFESYMAPRLRRLVDMAHSHGVKVMFHSCGAIVPLIESIIAAGVDILDPLQVAAKGMEPRFLKSQFGSRICLHGSIDTQYLLPHGKPDEVARTVREMIATLGAGGGFILAPSHVFQFDVTTANILALYETGVGVTAKGQP